MSSNNVTFNLESSSERCQNAFENLLNFSRSNFLTDFKIEVILISNPASRRVINVSKNVLASRSPYFLKKFREHPGLNKIVLNGIRFEIVNYIIDYLYSDSISINQNDISHSIRLAKLFQLDRLIKKAFNFIEDNLDVENVLIARDFCLSFDQMEKVESCDKYILNNFNDISKLHIFKKIEFNYLRHLLKSDDLVVEDEKRIFEIVVEWINVDSQRRKAEGQKLLKHVRYPFIPLEYLHEIADHEKIQKRKLFKKINESIYYVNKKEFRMGQNILKSVDVTPREYTNNLANEEELNERLLCIGGAQVESIEMCADLGSIWNKYDEMEPRRHSFASCTYENYIILIGGNGALQSCTKYDPKNKTFIELEPLPDRRFGHIATIINSQLFICGGLFTDKSLISLNLNERNGKWRNRKSSLEDRWGSTGCSVNNKFYVFGGESSNTCEYYCPQEDTWRPLLKMKEERLYAGSCYDNNKFIYVVGGSDRNFIYLKSMERFDVEIGQWLTLKSSIAVGRYGLTLTMFKNQIILIGGSDKDRKPHKTIQKYDSISDSWSQIGILKEARFHHCTVNFKF